MKFLKPLALAIVIMASAIQPAHAYLEITDQNVEQVLGPKFKSGSLTVLTFYADGCQPCKVMDKDLDAAENLFVNVTFVRANIAKNPGLSHGVTFVPLTLVLKGSKLLAIIKGAPRSQEELNYSLKEALSEK